MSSNKAILPNGAIPFGHTYSNHHTTQGRQTKTSIFASNTTIGLNSWYVYCQQLQFPWLPIPTLEIEFEFSCLYAGFWWTKLSSQSLLLFYFWWWQGLSILGWPAICFVNLAHFELLTVILSSLLKQWNITHVFHHAQLTFLRPGWPGTCHVVDPG